MNNQRFFPLTYPNLLPYFHFQITSLLKVVDTGEASMIELGEMAETLLQSADNNESIALTIEKDTSNIAEQWANLSQEAVELHTK